MVEVLVVLAVEMKIMMITGIKIKVHTKKKHIHTIKTILPKGLDLGKVTKKDTGTKEKQIPEKQLVYDNICSNNTATDRLRVVGQERTGSREEDQEE